jgi:hypothetical protein
VFALRLKAIFMINRRTYEYGSISIETIEQLRTFASPDAILLMLSKLEINAC